MLSGTPVTHLGLSLSLSLSLSALQTEMGTTCRISADSNYVNKLLLPSVGRKGDFQSSPQKRELFQKSLAGFSSVALCRIRSHTQVQPDTDKEHGLDFSPIRLMPWSIKFSCITQTYVELAFPVEGSW
jgi:hypothetical protein